MGCDADRRLIPRRQSRLPGVSAPTGGENGLFRTTLTRPVPVFPLPGLQPGQKSPGRWKDRLSFRFGNRKEHGRQPNNEAGDGQPLASRRPIGADVDDADYDPQEGEDGKQSAQDGILCLFGGHVFSRCESGGSWR